MAERVILASPREPCGATWLINCLLVLGIKTYRRGPAGQSMWIESHEGWRLDKREEVLKQWLPVLSEQELFHFGNSLEVQWLHEWPTHTDWGHRVMYFVRDPRDALYSRYCRENATLPFGEYLTFPDGFSLLDKIDHWRFFNESWLAHPRLRVIRFEDYKKDALRLLRDTVEWLGLDVTGEALEHAVETSSFENAVRAERAYVKNTGSAQLINRSGKSGEWRALEGQALAMEQISSRCAPTLRQFGYEAPNGAMAKTVAMPQFLRLHHFDAIRLPEAWRCQIDMGGDDERLRRLIKRLSPSLCKRAGLSDSEAHVMLDRLSEYSQRANWGESRATLDKLYSVFGFDRLTWRRKLRSVMGGIWTRARQIFGAWNSAIR